MQTRIPLIATTLIVLASNLPSTAEAGHDYRLSEATLLYQEAVADFAYAVATDHRLTRYERQQAPRLLSAAKRFHALALYPNDLRRLKSCWLEIEELQCRIERVLFSHRGCPIWVSHRPNWDHVLYDSRMVRRALDRLGCFRPHHPHRPPVIPLPTRPEIDPTIRWQSSYRYRSPVTRSYRYPNQVRDYRSQFHDARQRETVSPLPRTHVPTLPRTHVPTTSPSQAQIFEMERGIGRETSRIRIGPTKLGAVLSRRVN